VSLEWQMSYTEEAPSIMTSFDSSLEAGYSTLFPGAHKAPDGKYIAYWYWIIAGQTVASAFEFPVDPNDLQASHKEYERRRDIARQELIAFVRRKFAPMPGPKDGVGCVADNDTLPTALPMAAMQAVASPPEIPTPCKQCGVRLDSRDDGHACWRCGKVEWR